MKFLKLLPFLALMAACCPAGRPLVWSPVSTLECAPIQVLRSLAEGLTPEDLANTNDFESFEIVPMEDLNDDGYSEYLAVATSRAFTLTWIISRTDTECHREVYPNHVGEVVEVLDTYTNGWRDLMVRMRFNTILPGTEQRESLVLLTFDGNVYSVSEVYTCRDGLDQPMDLSRCQALVQNTKS